MKNKTHLEDLFDEIRKWNQECKAWELELKKTNKYPKEQLLTAENFICKLKNKYKVEKV